MKTTLIQSALLTVAITAVAMLPGAALAQAPSTNDAALYENNFEKSETGKVPEDFLVLDGQFSVKQENGNKVMELPGAPLETFGLLFGPTEAADIVVSAKVLGTGKGRRYPTFAIGANGVSGYRLQVSPGKKLLELYKGDEVVKSAPFDWKSGVWTELRLRVSKTADNGIKVEGKGWLSGSAEPDWLLSAAEAAAPPGGRASVWGSPYAGTPIQYDDLKVTRVSK